MPGVANLVATPFPGGINLVWDAPDFAEAPAYYLVTADPAISGMPGVAFDTSFSSTDFTAATDYLFTVEPFYDSIADVGDAVTTGDPVQAGTGVPGSVAPDLQDVSVFPGDGQVLIYAWPGGDETDFYEVAYTGVASGSFRAARMPVLMRDQPNGTAFGATVTPGNAAGEGAAMGPVSATPMGGLSPVTDAHAEQLDGALGLYWSPPVTAKTVTGYLMQWAQHDVSTLTNQSVTTLPTSSSMATITGLSNGQGYDVFVFPVFSDTSLGLPVVFSNLEPTGAGGTLPDDISDATAAPGAARVTLDWTDGAVPGTSWIVQIQDDTNTTIDTRTATSHPYAVTGLTDGVQYYFVITPHTSAGNGSDNTDAFAVAGALVTNLRVVSADGQLYVDFTGVSGGTNYRMQGYDGTAHASTAVVHLTTTSGVLSGLTNFHSFSVTVWVEDSSHNLKSDGAVSLPATALQNKPRPANSAKATALNLPAASGQDIRHTQGWTSTADEPNSTRTAWYNFSPNADGVASFDSIGSDGSSSGRELILYDASDMSVVASGESLSSVAVLSSVGYYVANCSNTGGNVYLYLNWSSPA